MIQGSAIIGSGDVETQKAYCSELLRVLEARDAGAECANVVTSGEDKAFDTLKQWLSARQNLAEPGLRQLRHKVLNQRKAR